jgi:predicted DNA-binding protein
MKKEYDFSKGVRGKFYHPDTELYLPIYLERETMEVLKKLSKKKGVEMSAIVNEWIRKDISIVETIMAK